MTKEEFDAWKAEMDLAHEQDMGIPRPAHPKLTTVWSTCATRMRKSRVPHRHRDKLYKYYLLLLGRFRLIPIPYPEALGSTRWEVD